MITGEIGAAGIAAFYRVISPSFAHIPKSGMGAARRGGRFNRPGQEALYLSTDEATALAEYKQDNPWLPPGTICTFFVARLKIADFSQGFDPDDWAPLWADHDIDWRHERFNKGIEPPTWYMADDVLATGLQGLLFPSRAKPGGINLVIYNSSRLPNTSPGTTLQVYDPDDTLADL